MSSYTRYKPEWVREDFIDFIGEKFNPTWAWKRVKASVEKVTALSDDFYMIQLKPNQNFQHQILQAGQNILVTVVVEGVRQQRAYSIVEQKLNGDIVIAVRIQGIVSQALSLLKGGEILEISQPQGEFQLEPVSSSQSVLLIASGSGITAIYALLNAALEQNIAQIDVVYFTRDDAFHVELKQLAQQNSQVHYHHINTRQSKQHLDLTWLESTVPHFKSTMTYACGAIAMMRSLSEIYQHLNLSHLLKQEYFQTVVDESVTQQPVVFLRAQQEFQAQGSLLESAEEVGLRPSHGCRMGVCNTCTCTKVSGSTKNMLTGEINHDANTQIKLCISQALSPVVINL